MNDMNEKPLNVSNQMIQGHTISMKGKKPYDLVLCRSEIHGFYIKELRGNKEISLSDPTHYQQANDQYVDLLTSLADTGAKLTDMSSTHQGDETRPTLISPMKTWHAEKMIQDDDVYFQGLPKGRRYLLQLSADGDFLYDENDAAQPLNRHTQKVISEMRAAGLNDLTLEVISQNQQLFVVDLVRAQGDNLGIRSGLKRLLRMTTIEAILRPLCTGLHFIKPIMCKKEKHQALMQLVDNQIHRIIARNINACHQFKLFQPEV